MGAREVVCAAVIVAGSSATSALAGEVYRTAWGYPLPAGCEWRYVGQVPTFNGAQCIRPWFSNLRKFVVSLGSGVDG